jgi:hypothetical protein
VGLMMWVYYFNEELKMKKPRGAKNWGLWTSIVEHKGITCQTV